jgi:hypothetical protein
VSQRQHPGLAAAIAAASQGLEALAPRRELVPLRAFPSVAETAGLALSARAILFPEVSGVVGADLGAFADQAVLLFARARHASCPSEDRPRR